MDDKRCLENAEVVCNGWPAHFARAGKSSCLKNAAALCHGKLGESLERISPLQTKEFLDILSPISIHPFLEIAFRVSLRQKEGRKPAPQKRCLRSVWFASSMSRRHIGASHRSLFRPASVSLNFFEAPRVEEPVATMCVCE